MKKILFVSLFLSWWAQAQQRPNVVLIISDDHAYQTISAYGNKDIQTPNIDRIAQEGIRFDKAYVTNSLCGPSRAVILTGKYSHKNGFTDNDHSVFNGKQNTFIKELTKNGYETAWIGKWHLESLPEGFSYYNILEGQGMYYNGNFISKDKGKHKEEGYVANVVQDDAEEWLNQRDPSKPFCLVIGHKNTHRSWLPDLQDLGKFDHKTFELPSTFYDDYQGRKAAAEQEMSISKDLTLDYDLKMFKTKEEEDKDWTFSHFTSKERAIYDAYYEPIRKKFFASNLTGKALDQWKYDRYMKDYLSTVLSLDRNVGRVLTYLDQHDLDKNTIVIYVSDQGFYMGEHGWFDKRFMYEESFRTPMVMKWPGKIEPGSVSQDFVMNLDLGPTILDAAGIEKPGDMDGKSFLPIFENKFNRDAMFYHYYEKGEHNVSPHFGVRTKRYKLIRFYNQVNAWELYDLKKDSQELHNLYGKKGYERLAKKLKAELLKEIEKYQDQKALKIFNEKL